MPAPRVIILNGPGSVGKSATARALQTITAEPFLHVAMDAFIDMLPRTMFGHPDGLVFATIWDQDKPSVSIRTGPVLRRAMQGMRHAVAAMAAQGCNLVVDEVMLGADKVVGQFELPQNTFLAIGCASQSGRCHIIGMTTKRTPRPRDPVQLGKLMVDIMTGQIPDAVDDGKDEAAAKMGRRGAASRNASLTSQQRSEIAKRAASKRWEKNKPGSSD